jgi:hypothetical protein
VIEVEGLGVHRTRVFCAGARLYQVAVSGKPMFRNEAAADYFLDSFRPEAVSPGP